MERGSRYVGVWYVALGSPILQHSSLNLQMLVFPTGAALFDPKADPQWTFISSFRRMLLAPTNA